MMPITRCLSCFEPLYGSDRCIHRQRYLDALEYVISRGIVIEQPDYDFFAWKAADSDLYDTTRRIRISSVAYKIYGWDVMTSVLIHEFGHCDLFKQGIGPTTSWEEALRTETMANERGLEIMPSHLVPEAYQQHREFFLKAYFDQGWTEAECLAEWKSYSNLLFC